MWVVNEQDFQFSRSHWVMVYQNKKKTYFPDSFGRDFTHYDSSSRDLFTKYLEDCNL